MLWSAQHHESNTGTTTLPAWALLFARVSVAPLFLYSGTGKVMAFSETAARLYGGAEGFGKVLASGAIAAELGCGVALLLGLFARQAAVVLILFTIAATLMFHAFWAAAPAQLVVQTINFLKNLGLVGALSLIATLGAGSISVDAALAKARK